jgi:hypothetical protein
LQGEVVGFAVGVLDRLLVGEFAGIYEGLFVIEIVALVIGNVIGGLL